MNLKFWERARGQSAAQAGPEPPEIRAAQMEALATVFAPPRWLRDLGRTAWLLAGVLVILAGLIYLLGATNTIVAPVLAATIVAVVAVPVVGGLERRGLHRLWGSIIVLLALLAVAVTIVVIVLAGITGQRDAIAAQASKAADRGAVWLKDLGVDKRGVSVSEHHVKTTTPEALSTLVHGIVHGIKGLASIALTLSFFLLALFFLLRDGPSMRRWVDGHVGLPPDVARTISGGVIRSLRGYFKGVTLVAAFNAVVVGLGALVLGVPLAGTIAVVTFVTAYVPYIGAFAAGAFAVVIALGAKGTTTAVVMLVIVILANGLLQNIVQPFAMGSALGLHPLAVLVITISAGCIFGMVGLVLAAPLTSAALHIIRDLAAAKARLAATATGPPAAAEPAAPG